MSHKIEVICPECGKKYMRFLSDIKRGRRFCSKTCYFGWLRRYIANNKTEWLAKSKTYKNLSPSWVAHLSEIQCKECGKIFKVRQYMVKTAKFCSNDCKHKWESKNLVGEKSHNWKGGNIQRQCLNCGKNFVARRAAVIRGRGLYCSHRCWTSSKEYRELRAQNNRALIKPTKIEMTLEGILDNYFPQEWEYTGDGKIIIDGMIPDFFNKNGKKAVIELFGTYWHTGDKAKGWRRTELGRIMAYNSVGIKCLVIWEPELKNEETLIDKINAFVGGRNKCSKK